VSSWGADELARIDHATELQVTFRRPDGTLRPFVTIWAVRAGDNLYVRSAHGYENPWFQRALRLGQGRVRAGGVERDVKFEVPGPEVAGAASAAYHAKYDRYGASIVATVVSPEAMRSTLRVLPA
jgi:hypothetical protein